VLLAGAAVSTALGALLLSVVAAGDRIQYDMLYRYMYGSLTGTTWDQVRLLALWLLVAVPIAVAAVPTANLLRLGDQAVATLGRHPGRARLTVTACAALLCGATVGAVGPVAWVGFLAPLLARRFLPGADARAWLPVAAGCGAILTAAADLAARLAFAPVETPLGAWTAALSILGGIILLSGQQREGV
jgi:iron complex transport system permease protein